MDPTTLDTPFAGAEQHPSSPRVSPEPAEGYVLNPWSGLYQETMATYHSRLQATQVI